MMTAAIACASAASAAAASKVVFVKDGKAVAVSASGWKPGTGYLEGTGMKNFLVAKGETGSGAFHVKAYLCMKNQTGSAASFFLDQNYFGFEGNKKTLFVNGSIFGGVKQYGSPTSFFKREAWITFEVIRRKNTIAFMIDGKQVLTAAYQGAGFKRIGFQPARSTMQVRHFTIDVPKPRVAKQPKPEAKPKPIPSKPQVDEEAARAAKKAQMEAAAKRALKVASAAVEKDLTDGYLRLRAVAKRYRDTEAGARAGELAEEMYHDPKKGLTIKRGIKERDANEILRNCRMYIELKKYDEAYETLRDLARKYPRTKAAQEAKQLRVEVERLRKKRDEI